MLQLSADLSGIMYERERIRHIIRGVRKQYEIDSSSYIDELRRSNSREGRLKIVAKINNYKFNSTNPTSRTSPTASTTNNSHKNNSISEVAF